jgi:hypothetical protein
MGNKIVCSFLVVAVPFAPVGKPRAPNGSMVRRRIFTKEYVGSTVVKAEDLVAGPS